jgi:integrase
LSRAPTGTVDCVGGRWRVRLTLPDGTRRTFWAQGTTREEAEAHRAALLEGLRGTALEPTPARDMSLGAWATLWLEAREETHRDAGGDRARWRAYWSSDPLSSCSMRALRASAMLAAARRLAARGLAKQTTRNAWGTLRACLRAAVDAERLSAERWAELSAVPLPRLTIAREVSTEEPWSFLTLAEIFRVMTAPGIRPDQLSAFLLGVFTGLRAGELHALRWSDLDLEGTMPSVVVARSRRGATKSGRVGRVRLLAPAVNVLRWYAARSGVRLDASPSGLLWPGPDGEMHARGYDWGWTRTGAGSAGLRERAGLRAEVRWHDATRHTCASHLIQGTWCSLGWIDRPLRIEEVKTWLRHSNVDVTQRYAHLSLDSLPVTSAGDANGHGNRSIWSAAAAISSHLGELNPGPTVYETVGASPRLLAIPGAATKSGPLQLAKELLELLAGDDVSGLAPLALRLAQAVIDRADAAERRQADGGVQ